MYTNDIVYTNDIIGLYTNDKVYTNDITLISLINSLKLPRKDDQYAELLQSGAKDPIFFVESFLTIVRI